MFAGRKPAMDNKRQMFVKNMMGIFDKFEKATPPDFRGILNGDLLYSTRPQGQNGIFTFTPNTVQYDVSAKSKVGQGIANSSVGIVVHQYTGNQYSSTNEAIAQIQGNEVLVIPPVHVSHPSSINTAPIDKIEAYATTHLKELEALFQPASLKGIANIHTLFYKYINNMVDIGMDNLGDDFLNWLNTEKLSDSKRANITAYCEQNAKGISTLWTLIKGIMKLKDYLVTEFDAHPSDVKQSINGQPGGEGYVVKHPDGAVKLVSRGKFTAANRVKNR